MRMMMMFFEKIKKKMMIEMNENDHNMAKGKYRYVDK